MDSSRKLRIVPPAGPKRRESGTTQCGISHDEALAFVRKLAGSSATGPATAAERQAIAEHMALAGYESNFEPPPIDYEAKAAELGMTEDDLKKLLNAT